MPKVARKDAADIVNTIHVSVGDASPSDGSICDADPVDIATLEGSGDVFAENVGVVRKGDKQQKHTIPPACALHQTGLTAYSPNVFANNLNIGREKDTYGCGAKITSVTQSTVYAND